MAKVLNVEGDNIKVISTDVDNDNNETNIVPSDTPSAKEDIEQDAKPMIIKRDDKGKIDMKHMKLAWQHYLNNRPIQNEQLGIPWGFEVDASKTKIICDEVTGKPKSTWKNIYDVPLKEFSDLGVGTKLTFDFMRETGGFFLIVWVFGCIGWVIELANPRHIFWVDVTFVWDMIFVCFFIGYMLYVRRDMASEHRLLDALNITSSDYVVQVDGLPQDTTVEEVHEYFKQFGNLHFDPNGNPNAKLYDNQFDQFGVSLIRDDSSRIETAYAILETEDAIKYANPKDAKLIKNLKEKKDKVQKKWEKLNQQKYTCVGKAFVAFSLSDDQSACLEAFTTKNAKYEETRKKFRNGNVNLTVVEAPEPTDILWRNLQIGNRQTLLRQIVIHFFSFVYLAIVGIVMVFCAALNKANARDKPFIALLGTVGNILCCITSIVLLMPLLSVLEGVNTRSTLEVGAFLKLSWFQYAGTIFATLYVFGLDEKATMLTALSNEQISRWGSGLPTKNCQIPRFNYTGDPIITGEFTPLEIYQFDESSCWAYTMHLFGSGCGNFLFGNLIGDILLINNIDFLCPPWFGETMGAIKGAYYQKHLNNAFSGVDFKPFLRYQILLKFLMVGMTASGVDNPRLLPLLISICFFQCYFVEKFCFLQRYKNPPLYGVFMFNVVVKYGLPIALLNHLFFSQILFGLTYENVLGSGKGFVMHMNNVGGTIYGSISFIFFVLGIIFIILWFLPLKFWEFKNDVEEKVRRVSEGTVETLERELTFVDACTAKEKGLDISKMRRIEVYKYIPDPTRREFGVLKLN